MKFESFISNLDLGVCEDQQQIEAMFELAMLMMLIDGTVAESEDQFMRHWLETVHWNSELTRQEFYAKTMQKCIAVLDHDEVEGFVFHRTSLIKDRPLKKQMLRLAKDVAESDGVMDDKERAYIDLLYKEFQKIIF